jgi:hypothetical protein
MAEISYRLVDVGTVFEACLGERPAIPPPRKPGPDPLYENEIAVDVGSRCFGYEACKSLIIDHHFDRGPAGFPCAATAVLHLAGRICERLAKFDSIVIVTHRSPDSDACISAYLLRCLLEERLPSDGWQELGLDPGGWQDATVADGRRIRKIRWLDRRESWSGVAASRRWALELARYATFVDRSLGVHINRTRSLHAIITAAQVRGRSTAALLHQLPDVARKNTSEQSLCPLYDQIIHDGDGFAPELDLLAEDAGKYERDICRCWRGPLRVPAMSRPFDEWFAAISDLPLFDSTGRIAPEHLAFGGCLDQSRAQFVDAVFIRDPESLLFKEWARSDTHNSTRGDGFVLLVVARSGAITSPAEGHSSSRYWISLCPNKGRDLCLYSLWAELQAREEALLSEIGTTETPKGPRDGFEGRLRGLASGDDPWFDGSNYAASILDTPTHGTIMQPGTRADLKDDCVAQLVIRHLNQSLYRTHSRNRQPFAVVQDFDCASGNLPDREQVDHAVARCKELLECPHTQAEPMEGSNPFFSSPALLFQEDWLSSISPTGALRFAAIPLAPGVDFNDQGLVSQLGQAGWKLIEAPNTVTTPADFNTNHLNRCHETITLWNRRGLVVLFGEGSPCTHQRGACCCGIAQTAALFRELSEMARIRQLIWHFLLAERPRRLWADVASDDRVGNGQALLRKLAALKLRLMNVERRSLAKLYEALDFDDVVKTLHALNEQLHQFREQRRQKRWEVIVWALTFLVGVPTFLFAMLEGMSSIASILTTELPANTPAPLAFPGWLLQHSELLWLAWSLALPFAPLAVVILLVFLWKRRRQRGGTRIPDDWLE